MHVDAKTVSEIGDALKQGERMLTGAIAQITKFQTLVATTSLETSAPLGVGQKALSRSARATAGMMDIRLLLMEAHKALQIDARFMGVGGTSPTGNLDEDLVVPERPGLTVVANDAIAA